MEKESIEFLSRENFENIENTEFAGLSGFFGKKSFLQSSFWGFIQESYGRKCHYVSVKKNGLIVCLAVVVEVSFLANKFKYWYLPRGPVFKNDLENNLKEDALLSLKNEAMKRGVVFIRLEFSDHFLAKSSFLKKTKDVQPSKTIFIDLRKDLLEILADMKQKTRYNIRLAEKKEVVVAEETDKDKAFANFWDLIRQTSVRDNFSIHDKDYYYNLITSGGGNIRVFEASYEKQVVASGIFCFYKDCVSYLHGASSDSQRNVMGPYLLHFYLIRLSQENNFSFYDFYGVDDLKWPGVSRFKKGFGGENFEYPGTFDLVVNNFSYLVYRMFRFFRRLLF
jgi:lipid II:glycine glycyltransferase (peptidoglycan interpeptide bridge formation enzyme)